MDKKRDLVVEVWLATEKDAMVNSRGSSGVWHVTAEDVTLTGSELTAPDSNSNVG